MKSTMRIDASDIIIHCLKGWFFMTRHTEW